MIITTQCILSFKKEENKKIIILHILRLAVTALGLAGIAAHMNVLILVSLSADSVLQVFQLGIGIRQKNPVKSLTHLNFIMIDSLAIAGIVTGAWTMLAAAGLINALTMTAFGAQALVIGTAKKDPRACWASLSV